MVQRAAGLVLSHFSRVRLCNPMTVAHEAPLSMEFSRQEYWSELPFSSPGNLPHPGFKPTSPVFPALQEDSLPSESPGKPLCNVASIKTPKEGIQRASRLVDQNSSTCHLAGPKL